MAPPPRRPAGAAPARERRGGPPSPLAASPLAVLAPLALPAVAAACCAFSAAQRPGGPPPRRAAPGTLPPAAGGGPHQGRRIHGQRIAVGAGFASGMMFFDLEEKAQKDFTHDTIVSWLPRYPQPVRALEWFPSDDRANLKTILQNVAVFDVGEVTPPYYVAGCRTNPIRDYPPNFQDNFGKASFADWIRVQICKWRPGESTTLDVIPDDHLDIVLCDHLAVKRIGTENLAAMVAETNRMLKPDGDFMIFMPGDEVPPNNAEDLFSLEEELGGGEFAGDLSAYRLQPLKEVAPVRLRKRRRRRRKPVEPGEQPQAAADGES